MERIASNAAGSVSPAGRGARGDLSDLLGGLPSPDAVFVGGGVQDQVLQRSWDALPPVAGWWYSVTADSTACCWAPISVGAGN